MTKDLQASETVGQSLDTLKAAAVFIGNHLADYLAEGKLDMSPEVRATAHNLMLMVLGIAALQETGFLWTLEEVVKGLDLDANTRRTVLYVTRVAHEVHTF